MKNQLYLSCRKCGGVPEWDSMETTAEGNILYKFNGVCPLCGGGDFALMEVKEKGAKSGTMEVVSGNQIKNGEDSTVRDLQEDSEDDDAMGGCGIRG